MIMKIIIDRKCFSIISTTRYWRFDYDKNDKIDDCQCIEYEKNWVAKVTKLFAYKICILISLKKFFVNDKHVDYHLIEK